MDDALDRSPGEVLDGRYRLVTRIGRGGFGDVWHAEELLPDGAPFREVALKLLSGASGSTIDWAEEAKLLASFRHPSLVTIYAAGILAGAPPLRFVAMELLEGQTLGDLIRARGKIPWRRVLHWAHSTAAALDVIHALGVVHLDLKPANLFLAADGALKVLDFGIARRAGSRAVIVPRSGRASARDGEVATALFRAEPGASIEMPAAVTSDMFAATRPVSESASTGRAVIGTPGFMAPEVLELAEPTAAADAYALAVCIVQLTTGHLPQAAPDEPAAWDDSTAVSAWLDELRRATLRGELRAFDGAEAGLPRGLAALVRRLLSVDPAKRGVTPGKLAAIVEEAWERPHGVPDPPYFGLAAYPAEGEGLLFGRDDDIGRLGRELEFEPCVVLQGARGVGKSSLAIAGLVPYLARRGADGKDDWVAARVSPGASPDAALAATLGAIAPELAEAGAAELTAWCEASPVGVVLLVDPLHAAVAVPAAERAHLEALIAAIATGPTRPGLRVIAEIADEHTAALLETETMGPSLRASLRFVGAPTTAAVKDIVAAPAHFAGATTGVVVTIAAEVQRELRAGGTRLPYVALALRAWWCARDKGLGREAWDEIGGVRGALARHADRVMAAFDATERRLAEEILLRLSATDGAPVRWDRRELCDTFGADAGAAALAVTALEREHLVRAQGGSIEIGHEALLTQWTLLSSARLRDMERLLFLERLREAAAAWERADRHRDLLLHGALYHELVGRPSWGVRGLTPSEREFVAESRGRARWRRVTQAAIGLAAALVVVGGVSASSMIDAAREAEGRARATALALEQISELAAKSRRTDDPFHRTAFIAAAMGRGSPDGMLPLDLTVAAQNLPRADFLTLDHVTGPSFPWDERWLLGASSGSTLALIDFRPDEPEVIEDVEIDFDPEDKSYGHFKRPRVRALRPHADPLLERVPFPFDTSFATRSSSGEVKVFRLRDDGSVALAAVAPVRCAGMIRVAEAAPVLACGTSRGIARWDLRRAGSVDEVAFPGDVGAVSADGARVAAIDKSRVLLWEPGEKKEAIYTAQAPVVIALFGPRDRALAVIEDGGFEIVDERRPDAPLLREAFHADDASLGGLRDGVDRARWDEGGLDLGVCGQAGSGRWFYLKSGGRAPGDPLPKGDPCAPPRPKGQPAKVLESPDFAELSDRELGPHLPIGGFRLSRYRFLSRDLAILDAGRPPLGASVPRGADRKAPPTAGPAAGRLLRFRGRDEIGQEEESDGIASAAAVERGDGVVAFQIGDEVRLYTAHDENRLLSRKGNLLRRCADGRFVAWVAAGVTYDVIDVWTGSLVASVPRDPGFVVGVDSVCKTLYTQRLDGAIVASPLFAGLPSRVLATIDGYVYDARSSAARGPEGAGLWLAVSSGAIARIDEATGALRILGYASPLASAIADGPRAGEVAYADATGVLVQGAEGAPRRVLEPSGDNVWEDLSVAPDAESMILASADRIAALDLTRRELLGWIPVDGKGRLARWDSEGSVLAWSFDRRGGAEGLVIPRGVTLAKAIAEAVSNLDVERGRLVLRR